MLPERKVQPVLSDVYRQIIFSNQTAHGVCTVAPIFEDAAGFVGIGTTTPFYRLHILNNVAGSLTRSENSNANGIAVRGVITAAAGAGTGLGGFFTSNQSGGAALGGDLGGTSYWIGSGVSANSNAAAGSGIVSASSDAGGSGVVGGGNNINPTSLVGGSGGSFTGNGIALAAWKDGALTNGQGAAYMVASTTVNTGVYVAYRNAGTNYKIINAGGFGGLVSTDVLGVNNDYRTMFCPESPEVLFQDFGKGQWMNGQAHITLDPTFSKNIVVNDNRVLQVYVQLEGDCKGVFVTNKTKNGFDVIELQGGNSTVSFTWFVSANRAADYINPNTGELVSKNEGLRFPLAPEPMPFKRMVKNNAAH